MGVGLSFFRRAKPDDAVIAGAVFRRVVLGNVVETARVVAITSDQFNIPHVRFLVRNNVGDAEGADDLRTLALASFQRIFYDRVAG